MPAAAIALDLTWDQLNDHVGAMGEAVRRAGIPEIVIGVLRGGMVPAVLLAHRLGVRDVRGIAVTHTLSDQPNGAKTARPLITNPGSLGDLDASADVLLVDDVAGSGATLDTAAALVAARARRVRRVALVVNTVNWERAQHTVQQQLPDYIGVTCAGWVRFPWEAR